MKRSRKMTEKIIYSFQEYLETRTIFEGDCKIWVKTTTWNGYAKSTSKYFINKYKTCRVHRMVYMYYYGSIPQGLVVMHSCDNRACVNKMHLSSGTQWENMQDMVNKGRQNKAAGDAHYRAKLTWEKVEFIRRTKGIFTGALIAEVFNVTKAAVNYVRSGRNWIHI
jgi:hypothetical protein